MLPEKNLPKQDSVNQDHEEGIQADDEDNDQIETERNSNNTF